MNFEEGVGEKIYAKVKHEKCVTLSMPGWWDRSMELEPVLHIVGHLPGLRLAALMSI